ncbi:ABC transporter ATP-binding protein [Turicibacter bilis]|uniref:ABC transporter ATP-binding protein n=1 Tax=Turicibacter bilis TaxID=2735723 RepID=UPI0031BB83A5
MTTNVIEIRQLTKDYGNNRGIFDVSLSVKKGEVFGFLGPNGAGKSTTIRHLMGFIQADQGSCQINGLDCLRDHARIQQALGYLPGEIAFMDDMTGLEFIKFMAKMKGMTDLTKAYELMERFELNPQGKIKKMSKGMKQKVGIICAFMHDPELLILDEPSSGLDPLMQNRFIELVLEEKQRGKTIFMSSHIFEEIERTCDRTAMIKDGRLISIEELQTLKASKHKTYQIMFATEELAEQFMNEGFECEQVESTVVKVLPRNNLNYLLATLSRYDIVDLDITKLTLEELFLHFYGGNES